VRRFLRLLVRPFPRRLPAHLLSPRLLSSRSSRLSSRLLSRLPTHLLSRLPAPFLSRLPTHLLSRLPAHLLSRLPTHLLSPRRLSSSHPRRRLPQRLPRRLLRRLPRPLPRLRRRFLRRRLSSRHPRLLSSSIDKPRFLLPLSIHKECVEGVFSEVRRHGVLRSSRIVGVRLDQGYACYSPNVGIRGVLGSSAKGEPGSLKSPALPRYSLQHVAGVVSR
jgi:hypothetical protein